MRIGLCGCLCHGGGVCLMIPRDIRRRLVCRGLLLALVACVVCSFFDVLFLVIYLRDDCVCGFVFRCLIVSLVMMIVLISTF